MATDPIFTSKPLLGHKRLAAANTPRDGTGTLQTLYTVPAGHARIDRIIWTSAQLSAATSSAMVGRIFITDASGSNPMLRAEVVIPTATPNTTTIGAQVVISFPAGWCLQSGQLVQICQSVYAGVQDQMDVLAEGGEF